MTQKLTSKRKTDDSGLTEKEFLLRYNSDKYPKPSLTADICIIADEGILLIRRKNHPYLDYWAFPGGFANRNEDLRNTAIRELKEETDIDTDEMELLGVYSKPGRDPRGWTVSAAYMKDLRGKQLEAKAKDDARDCGWFLPIEDDGKIILKGKDFDLEISDLAFDHEDILKDLLKRMKKDGIQF